jgi:hypothetical protein
VSDVEHETELVQLTRYFDGELSRDEEAAVLEHLQTCEVCAAELDDLVAMRAMIETPRAKQAAPAPIPITRAKPKRWAYVATAAAVLAAAAIAFAVWPRKTQAPEAPVAIALGASRGVEARFTAEPFAKHRPYEVVRGSGAREPIALAVLSELEKRKDKPALVAALASSGDLARAATLADDPAIAATDRAAIALLEKQPERALELLDGATGSAASWNRALALRDLGLVASAREEFVAVEKLGEPGWADEAKAAAATLVRDDTAKFRELRVRALAMIAGTGPSITADDATAFPAASRFYFLDALRVAADRDAALALAPIAEALDRGTKTTHARAVLDRVAASNFAVRGKFRDRYRALAANTFDYSKTAQLLDELDRAGRDADDIFLGALAYTGQMGARLAAVRARVTANPDPFFELAIAHEEVVAARARGVLEALAIARPAADACAVEWAHRCAQLALDAAELSAELGFVDDAVKYGRLAFDHYRAARTIMLEDRTLGYLGELERHRGRRVLARAIFVEVEQRAPDDCKNATYARIGRAKIALVGEDLAETRKLLAAIEACEQPLDEFALTIAIDLARRSAMPADRELATRWLDAAKKLPEPRIAALAEVGAARLAIASDPAARAPLEALVQKHAAAATAGETTALALRAWATDALIAAAGERNDWAAADAAARVEIRAAQSTACTVVASIDQDRQTIAVRGNDNTWRGVGRRESLAKLDAKTFVPTYLVQALRGCARIEVFARPPLHGRTTLLPPDLPWVFVGGPPRAAPAHAKRSVIVTDVVAPDASLALPKLAPSTNLPADAVIVRGAAATPSRVLAELANATYVEINAHGVVDLDAADASFLALSPEPSGKSMLTGADVRRAKLDSAIVVLAACRTARVAPYLHRRWTLPDAFLAGGARAVIATDVDVPDRDANNVFADLRDRLARGETAAAAVAAIRGSNPASWTARLVVFE